MAEPSIALGIIGAGIMGERLMRAALDHAAADIAIACIWDPSTHALARIAATLPDIPRAPDPESLMAASDCVYIASPPASHLAHARAALAAGRSVFCEKPLSADLADSRAFVAEARGRGAVNFPFASSFAVERLRGWIEEGAIGKPERLSIEVAFRVWPRPWQADAASWLDATAEGGFTREVVSHFLFLARRLLGPLDGWVGDAVWPVPGRSERAIDGVLRAGDVTVMLQGRVGETDSDDSNLWTLEGDAGAIRLRDWSIAERRDADGVWTPDPDAIANERARPLVLKRQLAGVAAMTRGQPHALATFQEALDVQEIVETILAASRA
ncbi:MAG: Gfo/Idh/MocA family oxidoreductase [Rhizobiales bacterium]|mgnify:CR=1 FL=1|nr:Gfo/Idh/MocA family oxidoreductase [Hyphomicrobiales bacterium]